MKNKKIKIFTSILIVIFLIVYIFKLGSLKFVSFSNLPTELDGGSCVFSLSERELENKEYIFVNDYGNYGFSVINGKKVNFELSNHDTDKSIYTYVGGSYKLIVKLLDSSSTSIESSKVKGTLDLEYMKKHITKNVFGECGS